MVTVPTISAISDSAMWPKHLANKYTHFISRSHFFLSERQVTPVFVPGEVVGGYTVRRGLEQIETISTEFEYTDVQSTTHAEESILENTSVAELTSELGAQLQLGILRIDPKVRSSLRNTFKTGFRQNFSFAFTRTSRIKQTFTRQIATKPADAPDEPDYVLALAYSRHAMNVYLAYLDYLFVNYKSGALGIPRYRKLEPPAKEHRNVIKMDLPLVRIEYWKQLPNTLKAIRNDEYTRHVVDPLEIKTSPLAGKMPYYPIAPNPTLHAVAQKIFPPKQWL